MKSSLIPLTSKKPSYLNKWGLDCLLKWITPSLLFRDVFIETLETFLSFSNSTSNSNFSPGRKITLLFGLPSVKSNDCPWCFIINDFRRGADEWYNIVLLLAIMLSREISEITVNKIFLKEFSSLDNFETSTGTTAL